VDVIQYVRAGEVAELLGVSERTVLRLAAQGRIPSLRVGSAVRFDLEAVMAALRDPADSKGHRASDSSSRSPPQTG
jgi:excisionase family DNA binding protein